MLPRNDAGNSKFICDEIPRSSRGMTQGLGNSRIFVIASEAKQSLGILDLVLGILEFPKIRHCEALKKAEAISFIKSCLLSLKRDCFGCFAPSQ